MGSDRYVATVTPAEAIVSGRPLLVALWEDGTPLPQPRLVADGDVKGGRTTPQSPRRPLRPDAVLEVARDDGDGSRLFFIEAARRLISLATARGLRRRCAGAVVG